MLQSQRKILAGVGWTTGAHLVGVAVRFVSSVVLTRLLAPEVFGVLTIVSTVRAGLELVTDVGIGQNIVHHKDGDKPDFVNTAWLIQSMRGFILGIFAAIVSIPVSLFYGLDPAYLQIGGLVLAIFGLQSTAMFLMQRRLQVSRLVLFDLATDVISSVIGIVAALINPTIWAILIGNVVSAVVRTVATHLLPGSRHSLTFDRRYALDIISFGKWIFVGSLLTFACTNFDRLYLGYALPLAAFGVFAVARTLAELPSGLFLRICYSLLFPLIAADKTSPREVLRRHIGNIRFKLLLLAAAGMGFGVAWSDLFIRLIYDARYWEAGWMLPILLVGVWVNLLATLGEYTLLGVGRPVYGAIGSGLKLGYLTIALAASLTAGGIVWAVVIVALSDIARLVVVVHGTVRERMSFVVQDLLATGLFVGAVAFFSLLRGQLGYGSFMTNFPV